MWNSVLKKAQVHTPQNGMATGLNIQTHLEKKVCQSEWSVLVAWSVVQCGSSEKGT